MHHHLRHKFIWKIPFEWFLELVSCIAFKSASVSAFHRCRACLLFVSSLDSVLLGAEWKWLGIFVDWQHLVKWLINKVLSIFLDFEYLWYKLIQLKAQSIKRQLSITLCVSTLNPRFWKMQTGRKQISKGRLNLEFELIYWMNRSWVLCDDRNK